MKYAPILIATILFSTAGIAGQSQDPIHTPDARMLRFPDVSKDEIVFVYAGDLWTAARQGDTDRGVEWYPDGKNVLYRSTMVSPSMRFNRFFKQPAEGGLPQTLPLPYAE